MAVECEAAIGSLLFDHLDDGRLYALLGLSDGNLVQVAVDAVKGISRHQMSIAIDDHGCLPKSFSTLWL
jgi:hypothetical protein